MLNHTIKQTDKVDYFYAQKLTTPNFSIIKKIKRINNLKKKSSTNS